MSTAETFGVAGAVIACLVAMVQALLSYIYTSNKSSIDKSLGSLLEQNRQQALDLERLKQQQIDATRHDDRVLDKIDKLGDKVEKLTNEVAMLSRRSGGPGGGSGGEYPATRPRTG
jgi:hypothetical protein